VAGGAPQGTIAILCRESKPDAGLLPSVGSQVSALRLRGGRWSYTNIYSILYDTSSVDRQEVVMAEQGMDQRGAGPGARVGGGGRGVDPGGSARRRGLPGQELAGHGGLRGRWLTREDLFERRRDEGGLAVRAGGGLRTRLVPEPFGQAMGQREGQLVVDHRQ